MQLEERRTLARTPVRWLVVGLAALVVAAIAVVAWPDGDGGPEETSTSREPVAASASSTTSSSSPTPAAPLAPGAIELPAPLPGIDTEAVVAATYDPIDRGDEVGAFRTTCRRSHYAYDDPIVFPGRPGASHLHLFFGATDLTGDTTDPRSSPTSTCEGGLVNRTGYWVPAMLDGDEVVDTAPIQDAIQVYYKTTHYDGVSSVGMEPFPAGLKMIAGDPELPQLDTERIWWSCQPTPQIVDHSKSPSIPVDCPAGQYVQLSVEFPQCWNGRDLDAPDHRSHLAYGLGWPDLGCPDSHPVALPAITEHVRWESTGSLEGWRLSSDPEGATVGGASAHADWWNGWDPEVMERVVANCLRTELDCQMNLLGDGEMLSAGP